MGGCFSAGGTIQPRSNFLVLEDAIGRGGFGKVYTSQKNGKKLAVKKMLKARVMNKDSVDSVLQELNFLTKIDKSSPSSRFLVNVHYAYQDLDNLYLALDLLTGGDFRFHLLKERAFQPECTQFFIACIAVALDACHKKQIVHRDLKPENLVFDSKGYLYLTDFGIALEITEPGMDNHDVQSGTPGYMAPEVMLQRNHSYNADFFALGVIAHECMTGKRPYKGKSKDKIRDAILADQASVKIDRGDPWDDYPAEAADFINTCLLKNPRDRFQDFDAIKRHPYFEGFDWEALLEKRIEPLYIPSGNLEQNFDKKNVEDFDYDDEPMLKEHKKELKSREGQELFAKFSYNIDEEG